MRRVILTALICFAFLVAIPILCGAQDNGQSARKLVLKVTPAYPDLARKINLSGSVKLLATVEPNGRVKRVEVFGGSPVLAQAAESAVQKWKWVPAAEETKESIEINFHPK
jgi:TonB family protein